MVDEAIDGFVGDDAVTGLITQRASNLLGRPTRFETLAYISTQQIIPGELEAGIPVPAPFGQSLGASRLIPLIPYLGRLAVAIKLPADRAGRAAQCPGNRAYGRTRFMQSIQFDTLAQRQMLTPRLRNR